MKIAVIGAGAMGLYFGSLLSRNNNVTFIDSFQGQVDSINNNGITLIEYDNTTTNYKNVIGKKSGDVNDKFDLIIILVKSYYLLDTLNQNKNLFYDDTIVLTLQNGAGNDKKIEQFVNKENILIGTTTNNCTNMGDATTKHNGVGHTTIGSKYNNNIIVEKVYNLFIDAKIDTIISNDIQRVLWSKLFVNLSINSYTALTSTRIGFLYENTHAWNICRMLVSEAVYVAEADGTHFNLDEALNFVKDVCLNSKNGYSSMYQDRKKKVKMEIDAINGAIVEQAKLYNIKTPYNLMMVELIHSIEGTYNEKI